MHRTIVITTFAIALASGWMAVATAAAANHQKLIQPHPCSDMELTDMEARRAALQLWEYGADPLSLSLKEILGPAMDLIRSIVQYVAHHPWILLAFIIPALELWIPLVGFEAGAVVAGSFAAVIQSAIGNVPKGSMFAFLQSYGAGGFARHAMRLAGAWVVVALLLAAVGKLLMENEVKMGTVVEIVERVWNSTVAEKPSQGDFLSRHKIEL
ncbi:MAG: hypothetical protein M1839_003039 [Geoglossum umbratile]|nr:MAG: hypothetical protein M1839_003039 [Geoglossum umbratile]